MGAEWTYLLTTRKVAGDDSAFSYVRIQYGANPTDTVTGVVIYPDDFSFADAGVGAMPFGPYAVKQIDADEWEALENVGCVFIPATNSIDITANDFVMYDSWIGIEMCINSSTASSASNAYTPLLRFAQRTLNASFATSRNRLWGVRLAQDL